MGGGSPARRGAWGERGPPLHPLHPCTPLFAVTRENLCYRTIPRPPRVARGVGAPSALRASGIAFAPATRCISRKGRRGRPLPGGSGGGKMAGRGGGTAPPGPKRAENRAFSAKRQAVWLERPTFQTENALKAALSYVPVSFSGKARWGRDGGPGGKNYGNAFPRFATERLGPPAPAATEWQPQAVPVATKEATGIDSRDEGFPFPPDNLRIVLTGFRDAPWRRRRQRLLSSEPPSWWYYGLPSFRRRESESTGHRADCSRPAA